MFSYFSVKEKNDFFFQSLILFSSFKDKLFVGIDINRVEGWSRQLLSLMTVEICLLNLNQKI